MIWLMKSLSIQDYLGASKWIDHAHPKIRIAAQGIAERAIQDLFANKEAPFADPELVVARACFHYVRDEINHSVDAQMSEVTIKASEVLEKGHGLCYAKSHLLAALLRANGIPAAICYQYIRLSGDTHSPLIVHALNAICPESLGKWMRLDARGNTNGINAQFSIEDERVAFPVDPGKGETDLPHLFAYPDKAVIHRIQEYVSVDQLCKHLPEKISGAYDMSHTN